MSTAKRFYHEHYTGFLLTIIVISLAASLILLASQGAAIRQQNIAIKSQLTTNRSNTTSILNSIQAEQGHQDTREACLFNLFVSFINSKKPISQADVQHCSVLEASSEANTSTTSDITTTYSPPNAPQTQGISTQNNQPNPSAVQYPQAQPSPIQNALSPVNKLLGGL